MRYLAPRAEWKPRSDEIRGWRESRESRGKSMPRDPRPLPAAALRVLRVDQEFIDHQPGVATRAFQTGRNQAVVVGQHPHITAVGRLPTG